MKGYQIASLVVILAFIAFLFYAVAEAADRTRILDVVLPIFDWALPTTWGVVAGGVSGAGLYHVRAKPPVSQITKDLDLVMKHLNIQR